MTTTSYHDQLPEEPNATYNAFLLDLDLVLQHYGFLEDDLRAHPAVQKVVSDCAERIHDAVYLAYGEAAGPVTGIVPCPEACDHEAAASTVAPLAASNEAVAAPSALEQASQIVRSASGTEIDWKREPRTAREATIRQRWIERQLEDDDTRWQLAYRAWHLSLRSGAIGSDLAAAAREINIFAALQRPDDDQTDEFAHIASELAAIASELDAEGA